jgi:hypothetical protein
MEEVRSIETSVNYQTTQLHIPKIFTDNAASTSNPMDVCQCFSTKILYEFHVFPIVLASLVYEESKTSLPWQNPYINAKQNDFFPVLIFSLALQNLLEWNDFNAYYDNSVLLRIMCTLLPQTVFWEQNHGGIISIVSWMWCAGNATGILSWVEIHCFSFYCIQSVELDWFYTHQLANHSFSQHTRHHMFTFLGVIMTLCSLLNISTLFSFCHWPVLSQFPVASSVSHLTHSSPFITTILVCDSLRSSGHSLCSFSEM